MPAESARGRSVDSEGGLGGHGRPCVAPAKLSRRFGAPAEGGIRVAHDLTQEELAQLVGASRETVNKALADFSARGWIRLEQRSVVLLDVERLRRRAR